MHPRLPQNKNLPTWVYPKRDGFEVFAWIKGERHYLGYFKDLTSAAEVAQQVREHWPDREMPLHKTVGTITPLRSGRWGLYGPRPERRYLRSYDTRWAAERARKLLKRDGAN